MDEEAYRHEAQKARDEAVRLGKEADEMLRVEAEDVDALYREATNHPDQADYWKGKANDRQSELNRLADDMRRKAGEHERQAQEYDRKAAQAHQDSERKKDALKEIVKRRLGF